MRELARRLEPLTEGAKNPWDQFKVRIFKLRHKTMNDLPLTERFVDAVASTSDNKVNLDNSAELFLSWYRTIFLPRWWNLKPKKARKKRI